MSGRFISLMLSKLFSNDYLDEDVRVEQPERFVIQGNENKVFKLKKRHQMG